MSAHLPMTTTPGQPAIEAETRPSRWAVLLAWLITLSISLLPNALWYELVSSDTRWLFWVKVILLAALAGLSLVWQPVRPLRKFLLIMLAIFAGEGAVSRLTASTFWQGWLGGGGGLFTTSMLSTQLSHLITSVWVIGVLLGLGYRRTDFFLSRGQLDAPIRPVRWLGFPKPDPWTRFGGQWAIYIGLGVLAFLFIAGPPSIEAFVLAAPLFPAVLLFAAVKAFNEEMTYRASMLASLEKVVGPRQALWLAALFFGLGHYFGVPYGPAGVVMATFLGWMLGKAMLETRGFFWAWLIHFVQDVLIFAFIAAGSIRPGGLPE